jgi:hypothetical protein
MRADWLAAILLLAACSEPAEQANNRPPADPAKAAAACQQFTRDGLKLKARTRAQLVAEAGGPLDTGERVEPNRHTPGAQDSIIRFVYDGMIVQVRKPGPSNEMFEHVTVSSRKWLNFPYFRPGLTEANLTGVLGEPQQRAAGKLTYECGGGEVENPVVFEMKDGAVQRIVFNYYVD